MCKHKDYEKNGKHEVIRGFFKRQWIVLLASFWAIVISCSLYIRNDNRSFFQSSGSLCIRKVAESALLYKLEETVVSQDAIVSTVDYLNQQGETHQNGDPITEKDVKEGLSSCIVGTDYTVLVVFKTEESGELAMKIASAASVCAGEVFISISTHYKNNLESVNKADAFTEIKPNPTYTSLTMLLAVVTVPPTIALTIDFITNKKRLD